MTDLFYYADDRKVELTPSTAFIALDVSEEADREEIMQAVASAKELQRPEDAEVIDPFGIVLVPTDAASDETALTAATDAMTSVAGVQSTFPVYQMPNGEEDEVMILIPQFRVQFKEDASQTKIDALNKKHGVEAVDEGDAVLPNNMLLRLTSKAKKNALELANLYHESELTEFAEPDFVMKVHQVTAIDTETMDLEQVVREAEAGDGDVGGAPEMDVATERMAPVNDPFFGSQWALKKMRVPEAWGVTRGRSTLTIAVLDEGVQTNHPDLAGRIVSPYDATQNDAHQEPNAWDGHGTACAGIAGATANNGRGIAGVAPGCKIMPIRIAYTAHRGANWTTSVSWIYRGIIRAVQAGADVLSNSWGGGAYSGVIRSAFQYARTAGRNGKGCITIAATGNSDRANGVIYPAKYPEVLACGASNEWDQRKSRTSRDGETWWGSNYGPEVDFVAPGVHIYTTDNGGSGGYSAGEYFSRFNGTSSATPNAAGVAGLVLSVDPNLRQWEVRDILRLTARDLSPSGRDDEHGFGRIDAARAVQAASRLWSSVVLRLEFLGSGQECFMRFRRFRLYNSGLNRIRVNSFSLRSYDPSGAEIDRFEFVPDPGGIMQPGLAPGGSSGDDVRFDGLLLKAHGTRQRWSYRWRANWGYTYWRPSAPSTTPAAAPGAETMTTEEAFEEDVELVMDSENPNAHPRQVVVQPPKPAPAPRPTPVVTNGTPENELSISGTKPVTITIQMG